MLYNDSYNNNRTRFIEKYTFFERHRDCNKIMSKFPDRIPIICEKYTVDFGLPELDKHKYLVPNDITLGEFMVVIRKRIQLPASEALFLFVGEFNHIPSSICVMSFLYDKYKSKDGFLYITYSRENTFG